MKEILKSGLAHFGLDSSDKAVAQFVRYYELLISYNEKVNLTAITEEREVAVKHFLDSAAVLSVLELPYGAHVIDVGTGAGFPGLPIKLVRSDIKLTLADALGKRVAFLQECASSLGLSDVECVHARAEELAKKEEYREMYDAAVSRAVANMAALSEYCLPFVKVGGVFAALKGPAAKQELDSAKNAIALLGGGGACIKMTEIADSQLEHTVILVDKITHTPQKYPRNGNKAVQKPL